MSIVYDERKPIALDYLICPQCAAALHQPSPGDFKTIDDYSLHVTTRQPVTCNANVGSGGEDKMCGWTGHVMFGKRALG